jgi:hypothetical protein
VLWKYLGRLDVAEMRRIYLYAPTRINTPCVLLFVAFKNSVCPKQYCTINRFGYVLLMTTAHSNCKNRLEADAIYMLGVIPSIWYDISCDPNVQYGASTVFMMSNNGHIEFEKYEFYVEKCDALIAS